MFDWSFHFRQVWHIFIFLFIFLLLLHKSERFTLHIGLNWCVFHLVSPFQGSSEICNIQMSLDCEQAGLEVWPFLASNSREGNGTPLQYSCLENPMDGGAWWAAVHGVAKSPTRLRDFTFTFHFHALEKEMATHSSVLSWRIPGMGEPGGLPSMGWHRVGHDWNDLAAAAVQKHFYLDN